MEAVEVPGFQVVHYGLIAIKKGLIETCYNLIQNQQMAKKINGTKKRAREAVRRLKLQKKQADRDLQAAMDQLSLARNEERLLDAGYKSTEMLYLNSQQAAQDIQVIQPTRASYDEQVTALEA